MTEKKPYIVTAAKIDPEDHDVYDRHVGADDYYEIDPQNDNRTVGERTVYGVWLDEEGYRAFGLSVQNPLSNGLHIEEDEKVYFPASEQVEPAAETESVLTNGVWDQALSYIRCFFLYRMGWSGEGILTGVGDTGVSNHEYIQDRLIQWWDWAGTNGTYDGVDRNGHGRWCSAAAVPRDGRLVSGKILGDDGGGWRSHCIAFVYYFADFCNARDKRGICSLSLGGSGRSQAWEDAIYYAAMRGVLTYAAAGNDGGVVNTPGIEPRVEGVAAVDQRTDDPAPWSCKGEGVDVAGPGVNVLGVGGWLSGTSMATPLVARGAACLMSGGYGVLYTRRAIHAGANRRGNTIEKVGHGIVDLRQSYCAIKEA